MDIKSFNRKLSKISTLTDTGNDQVHLSSLEKDLILSYLRDLYDIVLDTRPAKQPNAVETKLEASSPEPKSITKPQPLHVKEEIVNTYPVNEINLEGSKKAEITPETSETSNIVKQTEEVKMESDKTSETKPLERKQADASSLKQESIAELFADEKVADLSDKLALSPVKDLTKSMGINERIFTQQELFGNNQQFFNDTLQRLNNCQNFEEAKQYLLENVVTAYKWTDDQKIKKAATFVKLVKRKFS